jgi:predicted P-loop ATPase
LNYTLPEYNPITDYFESLASYNPTTDKDYITQYANFVTFDKPKERTRFATSLKKHLVRMIKQVFEKGYYNKQCLVLVGEKQDTGKTSFLEFLCPPALKDYKLLNLPQDKVKDKDNRFALSENFIINLDELKSFNRDQVNALKSLFSYGVVKDKKKYANENSKFKRIASFVSSTNNTDFLTDETGSVRWLCFGDVTKIDFSYRQKIDINDVWRQAWHLFNNDFDCEVSADEKEESEAINRENYSEISIEEELLLLHYEPNTKKDKLYFKTTSEILLHLESIINGRKLSLNKLGQALKKHNFPKGQDRINGNKTPSKGYYVLPIKS